MTLALALAGCSAEGGFKRISQITQAGLCSNAGPARAMVEADAPEGSLTVEQARAGSRAICGLPSLIDPRGPSQILEGHHTMKLGSSLAHVY